MMKMRQYKLSSLFKGDMSTELFVHAIVCLIVWYGVMVAMPQSFWDNVLGVVRAHGKFILVGMIIAFVMSACLMPFCKMGQIGATLFGYPLMIGLVVLGLIGMLDLFLNGALFGKCKTRKPQVCSGS